MKFNFAEPAVSNGNGHRKHARAMLWAILTAAALWLSAKSGALTIEVYGLPPRVQRLENHQAEDAKAHEETNRLLRELITQGKKVQ